MNQQLPQNLNFSQVKPVGYPSNVKQQRFNPQTFNTTTNGVSSSDVIRFQLSTSGFWDPYSTYIKIEVDVSQMDGTLVSNSNAVAGSQQIDNSAQSFINQLIISHNGNELERIEEYDTIAAMLNDANTSIDNRLVRQFEGLGAQNMPNLLNTTQMPFGDPGTGTSILGWSPNQIWIPANSESTILSQTQGSGFPVQRFEFQLLQQNQSLTVNLANLVPISYANYTPSTNIPTVGYNKAFGSTLSLGSFEPLLTKNFPQYGIYKGVFDQSFYNTRQTFCIPLISGIFGHLMPKQSYKYIPMRALDNVQLEFRLNPYALFTSGYNDAASNTNPAQSSSTMNAYGQISRIWRITKFEIVTEMQYFEPSVENIILSQLNTEKGILLHTQSWMLGPRYSLPANTAPNGTYQVNLGFESLKNLCWVFMPDDFQTYTFCRKQFRISANVTSMYLKIGNEYYPPLPITGHAGNPTGYQASLNETDYNNSEFLIQLYKTFGKFGDVQQDCLINPQNFAINGRAYNPANSIAVGNNANQVNFDTALSYPIFHENRAIGRAIYAMNLETLNQDYSVISGINTIYNKPFEINLKADTTNTFPRNYTMYVFCNYDMILQLTNKEAKALGRA